MNIEKIIQREIIELSSVLKKINKKDYNIFSKLCLTSIRAIKNNKKIMFLRKWW